MIVQVTDWGMPLCCVCATHEQKVEMRKLRLAQSLRHVVERPRGGQGRPLRRCLTQD